MNRWEHFSDDELLELRNGAMERHDTRALPTGIRNRAGELSTEMTSELQERAAARLRREKTLSMADVRDWLGRRRIYSNRGSVVDVAYARLIDDLERRPNLDPEHDPEHDR